MKTRGKRISLLTVLLCLLPLMVGMFSSGQKASAAGTTVNVTLHKKRMDQFPTDEIQNNGNLMPEFDKYQGLPGVKFKVWDITADFYAALGNTDALSDDAYQAKVKALMKTFDFANGAPAKQQVGNEQVTDDQGTAKFNDLAKRDANGRYKVYYFEETDSAGAEADKAGPMILVLPAIDEATKNEIEDIHLYPKNKMDDTDTKKEVIENGKPKDPNAEGFYDYDLGQKIKFRLTYRIPTQIGQIITDESNGDQYTRYSQLEFNDRLDQSGVKFEGITQIAMDGTPIADQDAFLKTHADYNSYGVDSPYDVPAGFNIKMNFNTGKSSDADKTNYDKSVAAANYMQQYAGQLMTIEYEVSLTEFTAVDEGIKNNFTIKLDHDGSGEQIITTPDVPTIITGGKKFFKHEDKKETQGLGGAQFVVIKSIGGKDHYLTKTIDSGKAAWNEVKGDDNWSEAKVYTSADDGKLAVTGLEYGTYHLLEIKAPDGFKLLDTPVEFTISKGSYADDKKLGVSNISKGGFLPSTGGKGIIAFLIVGFGLMAFAINRYRRVRNAA